MIGWGRAVATPVHPIQICMRLDLDHTICTWAEEIKKAEKCQTMDQYWFLKSLQKNAFFFKISRIKSVKKYFIRPMLL